MKKIKKPSKDGNKQKKKINKTCVVIRKKNPTKQ